MDEVSLILGITGTGGVVCAIVFYILSYGMKSKCRLMKTDIDVNVHTVTIEEEMKERSIKENSIANLTKAELEEIILRVIHTTTNNTAPFASGNILIPIGHPHAAFLEDRMRSTTHRMNDSPFTRSRSESEESHRSHKSHKSHKSHHSRGKDDTIHIMREEI